jgi:hypothetical protein
MAEDSVDGSLLRSPPFQRCLRLGRPHIPVHGTIGGLISEAGTTPVCD